MIILGIDTSTRSGSIALVDGKRTLAETRSDATLGGHLLAMIDAMCTEAAIRPTELGAVAIGAGPGSFTGLRIGMATAKGIAFAARCPLWAVSSLAALAAPALEQPGADVIAAVLDARRDEVYAGAYRREADRVIALGDERVMAPTGLVAFAAALRGAHPRVNFVGDTALLATLDSDWMRLPTGAAVARLALAGARVDVLTTGAPSYIRPPEAELKYPDGVPGARRIR